MRKNHINSLAGLDLTTLTFSDIEWMGGTHISKTTRLGQEKKCTSRAGVQTNIGDIKQSVWCQLAEAIIQREGEQKLLNDLIEWRAQHNYTRDTPAEIRQYALQLHVSRIFDNPQWVDYIPFNRKYRPEALAQAHLVTIINECCRRPGEVTQEQIEASYNGTIACPHCGRWSRFIVPGRRKENPCHDCDCYDPDIGCTMSSLDRSYACPLEQEDSPESGDAE